MGATAALKLRQVAENLENILSLEVLCAAQAIDFRKKAIGAGKQLGAGTRAIYETIRGRIPFIEKDEYMKVHLDSALDVVRSWNTASL
jgi:histidine ammonia-lyase